MQRLARGVERGRIVSTLLDRVEFARCGDDRAAHRKTALFLNNERVELVTFGGRGEGRPNDRSCDQPKGAEKCQVVHGSSRFVHSALAIVIHTIGRYAQLTIQLRGFAKIIGEESSVSPGTSPHMRACHKGRYEMRRGQRTVPSAQLLCCRHPR